MPSRAVATTFNGMGCIQSARYGFVHGTSPAVGEIVIGGRVPVSLIGTLQAIRVDQSMFVGWVTNIDYDYEQQVTNIRMVDWRDQLRDVLEFGCFNMQDDNGLWYHIYPEGDDWEIQERSYISREWLKIENVNNFAGAQNEPIQHQGGDRFKSALWILRYFEDAWDFRLVADENTLKRLEDTIPDNVDFNSGIHLMDILASVVEKSGCQFSCYGKDIFHVTVRGVPAAGVRELVLASIANPCSTGAHEPKIGMEVNENSRKVTIIGDRNQYEWVFPCAADWNQNFKWDFTFGGVQLRELKSALNLTGNEKLSSLPAKFHDLSYWPIESLNNKPRGAVPPTAIRNDMTINEYIAKIPYRCYRVDPRWVLANFKTNLETFDKFKKLRVREFIHEDMDLDYDKVFEDNKGVPFPVENQGIAFHQYPNFRVITDNGGANGPGPDPDSYGFTLPLSASLVSNTQVQFTPYASARDIPQGWREPFAKQRMMVPLDSGVTLQIEERMVTEKVNNGNNRPRFRKKYILRLLFNEVQPFIRRQEPEDLASDKFYEPDYIAVRLSFDREIFRYFFGEDGALLRSREKKVSVRNLYEGRVEGELQPTIRQLRLVEGVVREQLAEPNDIAAKLAKKITSTAPITISGTMKFLDRAGMVPDGLVDSVSVAVDETGISETISYSNARIYDETLIGPSRIKVQGGDVFRNELIKDALEAITKQAMKDKDAIAKMATIMANGLWQAGGFIGDVMSGSLFGKFGVINVQGEEAEVGENANIKPQVLLPLNPLIVNED